MSVAWLDLRTTRPSETGANPRGSLQRFLNVVLLYDDGEMAHQARALVDRVAPPGACAVQGWSFDELATGPGPEGTASETTFMALEADLLVVAMAQPSDLPASLKSWFRWWLSGRDPSRRGALVALFRNRGLEPTVSLAWMYLETVAALAGLDFFPGQVAEAGRSVTWVQPEGTWRDPVPDAAWTYDVAQDDFTSPHRWGLND